VGQGLRRGAAIRGDRRDQAPRRFLWIWGAGPVLQLPTNSNAELGNKNWGLGPSLVVLHLDKGDPWVYGVLMNNVWSLSSNEQGGSYSTGLIQPFVNYNFEGGLYLTSPPRQAADKYAAQRLLQRGPS